MKVVKGVGPKRPKLIIVGEAPGETEEIVGVPFVGTDGKILDGLLSSAGIRREECYITNVVKIRSPQSKIVNLHKLGYAVEDFYPSLYEELEKVECGFCIPLGDVALLALTQKDGITKHRGSVYSQLPPLPNLTFIPTYHPGYVRELWQARGVVVEDLKKAKRVSEGGYCPVEFNTKTHPSLNDVVEFINKLVLLRAFSFDIETVGNPPQIACIGIGGVFKEGRRSLCVPLKHGYRNYWNRDEEILIWQILQTLFQTPHILKIGQYITFDLTVLFPFIGEPKPPWFDTNVAHHLIDPELPHTLAFMTSLYTDVPYYKDDPKDVGESWKYITSSERLWEYNGKDVEIPLILEEKFTKELEEMKMLGFLRGYMMSVVRTLFRISQRGMLVDEEFRRELLEKKLIEVEELQKDINEAVGYALNVNSPKQMMEFVYNRLNLPIQYHRKTRKKTLNKEALEKLEARYPNPTFQQALTLRKKLKEIGTYLKAKTSLDGKIRGGYNPTGTETGRSSCGKTLFEDGLDMQNIPEGLRGIFIPSFGKVFVCFDLKQAEALCVATFANCVSFLTRLQEGKKIYKLVGSWLFGKSEEEVDDDNSPTGEYGRAKRVTHGADYGLGPITLSVILKCSVKEAKTYLAKFHAYAIEIRAWHEEIQEELKRTRKLVTPFGRTRIFRARYGDEMFREAYANLPQSTVGEYLHQAMVKLELLLPKGAEIVQEGFDSLVVECWERQREEVKRLSEIAFDKMILWKTNSFKIGVDVKEVGRWE